MNDCISRRLLYSLFPQDGILMLHVADIDLIPAADVRPVVRGKWIKPKGFKTRCQCSECKVHPVRGEPNFCPNCGADMREAQSHE